ncbi:MAG: WD40 repeat domain-containing protein, partial [Rhodocyclaceae bacterium]|nr:WD40 repeat domain-containing protein [Rhodocyclaceae bacterium]
AERSGLAALSRSVAAQAMAEKDSALDRALLLAVEAHAIAPTLEAEAALQRLLLARPQLERILHGPDKPAVGLGFSADGRRLAAGFGDGEIRIWSLDAPLPVTTLPPAERAPVASIAFDTGLARAAIGSGQRDTITLRSLSDGEVLLRLPAGNNYEIQALRFSPDGRRLASANGMAGSGISLWDIAEGRDASGFLKGDAGFSSVAFSPDGQRVAAGGWAESVYLWEVAAPAAALRIPTPERGGVSGLAFAGELLVLAADGFRFVSPERPEAPPARHLPGLPKGTRSLAVDAAAHWLAAGGSGGVVGLWDLHQDAPQPAMLGGPGSYVDALAFSADGRWLASGGYGQPVRLHALDTVSRFGRALGRQAGPVASVTFSPDGRRVAAAGRGRVIDIWPREGGPGVRLEGHLSDLRSLVFVDAGTLLSADARVLPTAEGRVDVLRWTLTGPSPRLVSDPPAALALGGLFGMFPDLPALRDTPWPVAIAAGGGRLARPARPLGGRFALEVVDTVSGGVTVTLEAGFGREMTALAWDAGGHRVAAASVDGRYALWAAEGGAPLISGQADGACRAVAVSADGERLAAACGGSLALASRDADGWRVTAPGGRTTAALAFSPDGRRLVVGDASGWTAWDVAEARSIGERVPTPAPVTALSISPDGNWLASGDADGAVIAWQLAVSDWKRRACAVAGRTLDADEWQRFLPGRATRDTCTPTPR